MTKLRVVPDTMEYLNSREDSCKIVGERQYQRETRKSPDMSIINNSECWNIVEHCSHFIFSVLY